MKNNVYDKVVEITKNNISEIYEDIEVLHDSNLVEDLGFDSITIMQLIVEIEEIFGIEFNDADYEDIKTVDSIVRYILNKDM